MCNECCKEFCGWCRAFTRTERMLVLLETVLFVLCISGLAFFILHMVACSQPPSDTAPVHTEEPETTTRSTTTLSTNHTTLDSKVECTWVPSSKTDADTHYYKSTQRVTSTTPLDRLLNLKNEAYVSDSDTDGEEVQGDEQSIVIALVKMRPPNDITFGCILTIVSEFWVVTAASCIEAIEELDSLDSFIMMEEYGSLLNGRVHAIADLQVHPFYRETNKSYDVAALRSADSLARGGKRVAGRLADIDYAFITIGRRFHILGYGGYRSIERGANGRRLRAAHVYVLPTRSCPPAGGEGGALRHLANGRPQAAPPPAPPALCAGAAAARGLPCNYCGGAPLVHTDPRSGAAALVGIMRDNAQCGVTCEPQLYTPLPLIVDWLDDLTHQ